MLSPQADWISYIRDSELFKGFGHIIKDNMEDIEPKVFRQRALIEAKIDIEITEDTIKQYLKGLADYLELRIYGGPVIYSTHGVGGKPVNQGFDGFVALVDSGISISAWVPMKFIAVSIHTCKQFQTDKAVEFTKNFFKATEIVYKEF